METKPRKHHIETASRFGNTPAKACSEKQFSSFTNRRLISLLSLFFCLNVFAQTLPQGFATVQVVSGLSNPTALVFAPDERIFITQQNGVVRIVKNGSLLATPFLQLSVQASGERGLIGIALDPDFSTNHYVYLYYTLPDGSRNRISRFTANGDVAVAGSETILLTLDPLSSATNHNGGAMHFGPDGKLYVAVGENAHPANAQNLDTYHGKLLRINKDGSAPSGNPFSGSAQKSRVWAYGLRNPFTFDFQPGTGKLFVNDVGQSTWEEINDATVKGKNFGWPTVEGNGANSSFTNPVYAYPHDSIEGTGCAITGGVFFNPAHTTYPPEYWGAYFFVDYCNRWINVLNLSGAVAKKQPFAKDLTTGLLYITVGNDGNLYYLRRYSGALNKIIYTSNTSPAIVKQPDDAAVPEGQSVSFSVTATGSTPLSYQWRKNGINIAAATAANYTIASTKTSDAGTYSVVVSNAFGNAVSNNAQLTVTVTNQPPKPTILTPATGSLYGGGDTIRFSGTVTDTEDGNLPASAFSWTVDFHHDTHVHDGPPVSQGSKSGYFVVPRSGETSANVWYRLLLTVTDSKGSQSTVYRDLLPRTSIITLNTQPTGLQLMLDGQPIGTSTSVAGVEGIERTIGAPAQQASGITVYDFDRWLHGGTATQAIITPVNDATYTAVYKESPFSAAKLEAENAQRNGAVVSSNHAGFTGSGFVDYINASADYVEWNANAATAGDHEISFRYALEKGTRNLQIQVNGATVNASLSFPATGSWNAWADVSLSANLNAGTNKIRATAAGTSGPNIDYIIVAPQTLQAESALLSGAQKASNHAGYDGTGFADFLNASNDYVEWLVYKRNAGPVTLNFRYANGSSAARPMQVWVNDNVISQNFSFPVTGRWDQWSNTVVATNLATGINKIRLTAMGSGPNIDYLSWSSNAASTLAQAMPGEFETTEENVDAKEFNILVSPNPATAKVRLQLNRSPSLPVTVSVVNTAGRVCRKLSLGNGSTVLELSVKDLPAGLYLIVADQGEKRAMAKLIIN